MENDLADTPLVAEPHPLKGRHTFIIGFIALFPLMLTVLVLSLFWNMIIKFSAPVADMINWVIAKAAGSHTPPPEWVGIAVAFLLGVMVIYLVGLAVEKFFGRHIIRMLDAIGMRLPVVRYIYPYAKQLADFLWGPRKLNFSRVVAVEYPRKGIWSLGFMTSEGVPAVSDELRRKLVAVFVPTSPTPFTGWTVLVPEEDIRPVNMTVDEAVRFVVSCGVIVPGQPTQAPAPQADAQQEQRL